MENKSFFNRNLLLRVITSLILAPIVLFITYDGGVIFEFTVTLVAVLMAFEWHELTTNGKNNKNPILWKVIGALYITIPCTSLLYIATNDQGTQILIWLLIVVWASDISAFFVGKIIGGPKFAPKISPKKTWSGFLGTSIAAYFLGVYSVDFFQSEHPRTLIFLTVTLALYAQIGDLIESWIKRKFNAKDSGSVIPGHGGILDRVDGIVVTAPTVAFILMCYPYDIF